MTGAVSSLHIIGSRELGGAERFYLRLVLALRDAGHPVAAVNRASSRVAAELGVAVPQFHAPMAAPWDLYSRWRIARITSRLHPQIVQTYMTRATVLTHLAPHQGAVHVARVGGYYRIERFRHAHAWIGNTKGICDYLVRGGLPAERVHYIGNFVEPPTPAVPERLAALRLRLGIDPQSLVVFALGRFVRKKGFDVLLGAFERLPRELDGRPLCLVILGDGSLRAELERRALALAGRVHLPGWETDPAVYFDLADLFVCPSRDEPLGNVILESWAHGRAVVSTATVGARELITDGIDGALVPCDNPVALASTMRELLGEEGRRAALARAGKLQVESHFSKAGILGAYLDLYRTLKPPGAMGPRPWS